MTNFEPPHLRTLFAAVDSIASVRGPGVEPFVGEFLTMITDTDGRSRIAKCCA